MRAKIFFITLAVDDLGQSVAFYRDGLGWPTEGIVGQEFHDEATGADGTIAFFTLDTGLLLGWQREAEHPAESLAYWDTVAALSTPPDIDWFSEAIAGMTGRPDLTKELLRERRDAFLADALGRLS
jgi:catechol 2,3-dioxygenase-like lactoylglutathione lyase family enzyme